MLNEIIEHKRKELEKIKELKPLHALKEEAVLLPEARNFKAALKRDKESETVNIIAEIKRASPSHGVFDTPFLKNNGAGAIAAIYEQGGASAISVLTEKKYFGGSPRDLTEAKKNTGLPVLRKDFIFDAYQIYESKAMGADALLLIVSVLDSEKLKELIGLAEALNIYTLVETKDIGEIKTAQNAGADIIGINNRDLRTMTIDINRTIAVARYLGPGKVLVSESGIDNYEQVTMLRERAGVDAVLVGKGLVTSVDPRERIMFLRGETG